jgi:hypothetical protein
MADAVDSLVVFSGRRRYVARFTNLSDGTGEAAVIKVDKSTLAGPDGTEPSKLVVEKIQYNCDGMSVRLFWDHTADDEIVTLAGHGCFDWTNVGGLVDPGSAGGAGDIVLTTVGHAANDSYDITLHLRLKD